MVYRKRRTPIKEYGLIFGEWGAEHHKIFSTKGEMVEFAKTLNSDKILAYYHKINSQRIKPRRSIYLVDGEVVCYLKDIDESKRDSAIVVNYSRNTARCRQPLIQTNDLK